MICSVELGPWEAGGGEWGEYWEVVSREFNRVSGVSRETGRVSIG